jgi:acyl-CoA synthetase (AMP-forming)/AMP-acid ligase II
MSRADFLERVAGHAPAGGLPVDPDAVAVLLFTSGTSGAPKAALLRHRHVFAYVTSSVEFMGAGADEATLVSVPPYHVAAIMALVSSVYSGRRIVQLPAFEPEAWVAAAVAESVTHAMLVPTMLSRILPVIERTKTRVPTLRHLAYGGGRMPLPVLEQALELLPEVDFVNAYGLTETSSTISVLGPEDHREAFASTAERIRRRQRSVGRPLPTVELEIRDPEGRPAAPGATGEIWVRGEQVSGEYEGTTGTVGDGWFATRDAGFLDDDGYLYLEGRLDDVIVRGGENMSPGEIEDVLVAHPAVTDAAVVGVPDPDWGERVVASVVLDQGAACTEDELKEWVRGRLRSSRAPEAIEFRSELPYSETGKLLRRVLRAELSKASR